MTNYRNQSCIHKVNSHTLLLGHILRNHEVSLPLNVITLPAKSFEFEAELRKHYKRGTIDGCERDVDIALKAQRVLEQKKIPNCRLFRKDIFEYIQERKLNSVHAIQFDFCGIYSEAIHTNILHAIAQDNIANNCIFSLTTSWSQGIDKKFLREVSKQYCTIQYPNIWNLRNYRLPEIIVGAAKEHKVNVEYLGGFAYKSTTGSHGKGAPMQFQLFKVVK